MEALASEEVLELHLFNEKREWIERQIKLFENLPPVDVFGGIQELLASPLEPIACLPNRQELAKWVAEYDKIEHEAKQFDAGDMSRLKRITKAATQRKLSREDTDLIEVTLTTLLALDMLLHSLRGRSENLELMSLRLTWEEQRLLARNESHSILNDLRTFVAGRAQWTSACYENSPSAPTVGHLASVSGASGSPGNPTCSTSTSQGGLSREHRDKLAEVLSLDAAQLSTRLVDLKTSVLASGKTLDKLIDSSHRKPVPDEFLDEQDMIENENSAMEGLGGFATDMVSQWKKSDEFYSELKESHAVAVSLCEEIERAKLQRPNPKLQESFIARSAQLMTRLGTIGDSGALHSLPRPRHSLFPTQDAANKELPRILSNELAISAEAIRQAAASATQYQEMMESRTESEIDIFSKEMSWEDMFCRLVDHGCADLSLQINSDQYSAGFLAGGGFGDIWKGKLRDGTEVAIKVLRSSSFLHSDPKSMKRIVREIYHWSKVKHEYVQDLMGVVMFQGRLGMVSLWMDNGDLQGYLRRHPDVDRYPLCNQVATGLAYLHSQNIVHGDLKAANVLVSNHGTARLSDFDHSIMSGCSLIFSETSKLGGGTTRWMAPELILQNDCQRSLYTDVYALGMTMLEIVSGNIPYYRQCREDTQVLLAILNKALPNRPTDSYGESPRDNEMWKLQLRCWDYDPAARPKAVEVVELLQNIANLSTTKISSG